MNMDTNELINNSTPWLIWAKSHWLILLLIALAAVLLLTVLGIPLMRKYLRARKKEKDADELKKDLQAWRNISEIASGNDKKDAARQNLSSQLNLIRQLFARGMEMLKHAGKSGRKLPWFVLVGEPRSGKSSLLKESRLEIACSSQETQEPGAGPESLPVRCWLSGHAFVLDIGGKVFFDRWMGGSSAEWNLLLKLIVKAHRKSPLSGIILTIPADALLADSGELTKRKAALLVNEFQNMLEKFGMYLPCHVAVTKMDMLPGFREYFCDLDEAEADGVFGWRNRTPNGRLDMEAFAGYWKELVEKLHAGSAAAMAGASVHAHNQNSSESRLLLTGGMYMFPTEFEKIRNNLLIYLDRLFGADTWLDNERAMLSGVYFTSSKDGRVRLSSKLAEIRELPPDKVPLVSKTPLPKFSLFTKNLLDKLIFADTKNSSFTAGRKFRRHIPQYALCLLFAALAAVWGHAALYRSDSIRKSLQASGEYYNGIARMFEEKALEKSPLVVSDPASGKTEIAENLPLAGNPAYTRLQFFFESQQEALKNCGIPFGFQTAGWFVFQEPGYGPEERKFIANRIQAIMVFTPAVNLLARHFTGKQAENEPFTIEKRNAYKDFMRLENAVNPPRALPRPDIPVSAYLRYLTPSASGSAIRLLNSGAGKKLDADIYDIAGIVYKLPYQKAEYESTMQFLRHWENLTIYPNHPYSRLRTAVRSASVIAKNHEKLLRMAAELNGKTDSVDQLPDAIHRLIQEQLSLYESIEPFFSAGSLNWSDSAMQDKEKKTPDESAGPAPGEFFVRKWIRQYERQLDEDYAFVEGISRQIEYLSNTPEQPEIKEFVRKSRKTAKARFAVEKAEIAAKGIELRDSRFFAPLTAPDKENSAASPRCCDIVMRLLTLSDALSGCQRTPLKNIADFAAQKQQLDKAVADAEEQFEAYAKPYAENPQTAATVSACRAILRAHRDRMRCQFYTELLALYPDNAESFASMIAENAKPAADLLGMKAELAEESFGKLKIMNAYDSDLAMLYIAPVAGLLPPPEKDSAEAKSAAPGKPGSTVPASLKPRFDRIAGMLGGYLEKYNAYWAGYVDALQFAPGSWREFKSACAKMKPYQINTLLFIAYSNCADIINQVPDALLSKAAAVQKNLFLARLNARKQILAPHFSESCNRNVSAWRALPDSADQAFLLLRSLPEKQRNADYLTVFDSGAKGDIPWWSSFIQSGVSFMKRDAKTVLLKKLGECGEKLFSFPLCKNSPYADLLSEDDLLTVSSLLSSLGCPVPRPPAETPENPTEKNGAAPRVPQETTDSGENASAPEIALDFPGDRELPVWGAKLTGIVDALTNDSKPMTYTLTVPPFGIQEKLTALLDKPYPLAVARFPYLTAASSASRHSPMRFLQSGKDIQLLSGLISEDGLTFDFRSFSDESDAAATVKISGDWAVLRLYLAENSYFDPKTKQVCSPLFVTDKTGGKYVLWLGFTFNKVIPLPDDWPTTANCPDFSSFQTGMKRLRAADFDLAAEIMKAGSGEEGYRKLKNLIRNFEIRKFPVFTLSPADAQAVPANYPGRQPDEAAGLRADTPIPADYLRYPWLEVKTPERTVRINLAGQTDAGVPLFINDEHIQFRFFRHSDDAQPAHIVIVDGPYPLLRLLTMPGRKISKKHFIITLPPSSAGGTGIPLEITVKNER